METPNGETYNTRYLIDGELVEPASDDAFTTEDPSRGEVIATVPAANERDVDRAVGAARSAFQGG